MDEDRAIKLQSVVRGYLVRRRFRVKLRETLAKAFEPYQDLEKGKELLTTNDQIKYGRLLLRIAQVPTDTDLLAQFCRLLILSLDAGKESNFSTLFLNKVTITEANKVVTDVVSIVPSHMVQLSGQKVWETKAWQAFIHFFIVFSSANTWLLVRNSPQVQQILNAMCIKMTENLYTEENYRYLTDTLFIACNEKRPLISSEALNALFSLILRPFSGGKMSTDTRVQCFVVRVVTCPAVIHHLNNTSRETLLSCKLFCRCIELMKKEPDMLDNMSPQRTMNLLGNFIHWGYLDLETTKSCVLDWTWLIGAAMAQCTEYAVKPGEKTSHHHWHPIFGLYRVPVDQRTEGSLLNVSCQLQLLWSKRIVSCLFGTALDGVQLETYNAEQSTKELGVALSKLWRRFAGSHQDSVLVSSTTLEVPPTLTAIVCQLYQTAITTMQHLKQHIINGISGDDRLLRQLWSYLRKWGVKAAEYSKVKGSSNGKQSADQALCSAAFQSLHRRNSPHLAPIQLFAQVAASVVSILDDEEMYERGEPFPMAELVSIALFASQFCFKAIWNGLLSVKELESNSLFVSVHQLCIVLYSRDSRRPFVNDPKFWLAPDVKSSAIIAECESLQDRGAAITRLLSHVVTLKDRMILFRRLVKDDKAEFEGHATHISVQRSRLVEDGYRQLSQLSNRAIKNTIRVKFVNQQGLDEAGIDQDGVFKEFLELTLKQVFDPGLNLFRASSSGVLYPSSTSYVHDDHLKLFQFVGRVLAKAIYEGIVIDVQLAPVLLAAVIGDRRLCAFDELSQLDPELYRNLTFVKRYEGDVSDLALTFSIDEDMLGKVNTVDLIPGGRTVQVNNENRIDYLHRMAHHRVFMQTKEQCKAFVGGMQSLLRPQWLSLFAPHELQVLISGQSCDVDVLDLRKHAQYYGGFHSGHRVVKWLWDIVENEFSGEERRLFLKFVTSCSRPPLLGFSYLEPPFSIRCVEVSDDQDQGDTLGSVVRGFLTLKKGHAVTRLPTASTCFNLLKLPNYNKKSVLLEKLRYAIHSGTGFELS